MKLLHKICGINVPTAAEIKQQITQDVIEKQAVEQKQAEPEILSYITFVLGKDGSVLVKTEWANESPQLASVYAQLLYQIGVGGLEDGVIEVLLKHGNEKVQSQEFIGKVIQELNDCKNKYKNLPIITPTQALAVKEK
jgi:hypothetical protein